MVPFYKEIGQIQTFHSKEVSHSRVGIGFEKLDRAVFDPEKAYDRVAELGVKWVRLQSGWQRTETEKGSYHFEWLDSIVDNLRSRGLEPWVCLCYGNRIYDSQAAERFGGVGCPPNKDPEQIKAWHDYVVACVKHFEGRVTWWELWNEPDCHYSWRYQPDAAEYTEFARATAQAVREGSAKAKVIGGAFAGFGINYYQTCFDGGIAKFCDAISFHVYSSDESFDEERINNLKILVARSNPSAELIQGEGGCQSFHNGSGALQGQSWTEPKQARSLARHMISQLHHGVKFASYFSCMDMIEALNGKVGDKASYMDFGYFGVLGADFDENGFATGEYRRKPSYYALQTIASVFRGDFTTEPIPMETLHEDDVKYSYKGSELADCYVCSFRKPNGSAGIVLWKKGNLLREQFEGSVSMRVSTVPGDKIRLADMLDGKIYELHEDQIIRKENGVIDLMRLPLLDSPVLIAFGDFISVKP